MLRSVGVPDWLITYHPSEFERAALRLIGSDAERVAIAERLLETDIEGVFKDRPDSQYSRDFAAAVWNLYARHEEIQRSAVRYWTVADRLAAGRPEATPAALLTP